MQSCTLWSQKCSDHHVVVYAARALLDSCTTWPYACCQTARFVIRIAKLFVADKCCVHGHCLFDLCAVGEPKCHERGQRLVKSVHAKL